MIVLRCLAALPFLGILVSVMFFNHANHFVAGFSQLSGWLLLWIGVTGGVVTVICIRD